MGYGGDWYMNAWKIVVVYTSARLRQPFEVGRRLELDLHSFETVHTLELCC